MLNRIRDWARTRDWVPILASALVLALALLVIGPRSYQAYDSRRPEEAANQNSWGSSGLWEAMFTGAIALLALSQLRDNRRSNERQLRAYVGFTSTKVTVEPVPDPLQPFRFNAWEMRAVITIKNSGQTPAYDLQSRGGIRLGHIFDPMWIEETDSFDQNTYVLPEGELYFRTKVDMLQLSAGVPDDTPVPWTLFIFGRIEYRDTFERDRWVNFRYKIAGYFLGMEGPSKPTVHPCEQGNDAN